MMLSAPVMPLSSLALNVADVPDTLKISDEAPFMLMVKLGIAASCAAVRSMTAIPLAPACAVMTSLLPVVGSVPVAESCDNDCDSESSVLEKLPMLALGAPIYLPPPLKLIPAPLLPPT